MILPQPPLDGSLHPLFGFVDWQAEHNPSQPFVVFPEDGATGAAQTLSFSEFSEATHRVAHAVRPGRKGRDREVVALVINCDTLLYQALIIGVSRAGWVPFPMSPRNSVKAIVNMLKKTAAHRIICEPSSSNLISSIESQLTREDFHLERENLPSIYCVYPFLYQSPGARSNLITEPYPSPFCQIAEDEVVLYLHSSGSTGLPKPIPTTKKIATQWAGVSVPGCVRQYRFVLAAFSFPTFHAFGFNAHLYVALSSSQPIAVYGPRFPDPPVIPTMQNILSAAKITKCTALTIVPSFLEAFSALDETIQYLASLKMVAYGGGPLSRSVGDRLVAAGVCLASVYGGTEFGGPCPLLTEGKAAEDWEYQSFSPQVRPRWIVQGDGTFELQLLTCDTHQLAIENLPNTRGYNTSDLFIPHPTKPDLWKIVGRTDDIITLSTGEKVVPIPQEGYLHTAPMIAGAVMFGSGRNQPGLLVELRGDHAADAAALAASRTQLWPYVETANKLGPGFARIFKELIVVAHPSKPLPRASKNTIQKKLALSLYSQEINDVYSVVNTAADHDEISPPAAWTSDCVERWLSQHITIINDGQQPSTTVDLFQQGFDSLSATSLRNQIIRALKTSTNSSDSIVSSDIPVDIVFANPTIRNLARALQNLVGGRTSVKKSVGAQVEDLISKYSADLPDFTGKLPVRASRGITVVLTGSTGGLGSHLLAHLLQLKEVARVYTLDRPSPDGDRQKRAFFERGLSTELLDNGKLTALTANHTRADLGLSADVLDEIKRTTTHIIHNAWKLDFNLSVGSFEDNIAYSRFLVDICSSCRHAVKLIFTSSIGSAGNWDSSTGRVPENILETLNCDGITGYGASKYVVEKILSLASRKGLAATSLRIGQISGASETGSWNISDWVPLIVRSSIKLGCLPALDGDVAWIPMDTVCRTISDILFSLIRERSPEIINVVHPHLSSWNRLFTGISGALGGRLSTVSYNDWFSKIETLSVSPTDADFVEVPAIKIVPFLRAFVSNGPRKNPPNGVAVLAGGSADFATNKAEELSPSLRDAPPLTEHDAAMWVQYWKSKGLFA
ncbi:acetyl-CoA synthetase-like protein [Cristinia sonorae]|uniref:Acetyl-CoA synthetase-like protein n=1 Tax=Cristinia sonorae TaxID=1940300 RepID=A0A8K0UXN4_9AGAR|nr:acetyl-CoA synthetase-like protein [Cristinia sonorae]